MVTAQVSAFFSMVQKKNTGTTKIKYEIIEIVEHEIIQAHVLH